MSDIINRADVINVTWQDPSYTDPINVLTEVRDKIRELPSAEQWIPCSERLPDVGELVLTTIKGTDIIVLEGGETLEDAVKRTKKMVRVSVGFLESDGWYGADGFPEIVTPCAWMPLPKPWKGEQNE